MGKGGVWKGSQRDSKSPRNSKKRVTRERRRERDGERGGSRSPASRLDSMISGLSDESDLSTSSDDEAAQRHRLRTRQAAAARSGSASPRSRSLSPTPSERRQQTARRYLPQYSDSDSSDSDDDTAARRSHRKAQRTSHSAVRLDLTGLERALDTEHWPRAGAEETGCLHCRFVWDPHGEFERHKVEGTVRDLMEGKQIGAGRQRLVSPLAQSAVACDFLDLL